MGNVESVGLKRIGVEVPVLSNGNDALAPLVIQLRLSPKHRALMQNVVCALATQGARLDSGKRVATASSALTWVMEQIGKSIDSETPPVTKPAKPASAPLDL